MTYDKVQEDASIQEIVVLLDLLVLLRGLRLADREDLVRCHRQSQAGVYATECGWCISKNHCVELVM